MDARWICRLAAAITLFYSSGLLADEKEAWYSIGGFIRYDEPVESQKKRHLELRELIHDAASREQTPLHLGEVAFNLERILPAPNPDRKNSGSWTNYLFGRRTPHVAQLENDLVLIDKSSSFEWVTRASLVTPTQLEAAATAYLTRHPQEAEALADRAIFRMTRGRVDEAISDITRAVNLRPDCVSFLFIRGAIWLAKQQLQPALDDLDEAIALAPENPNVYLLRAAAFIFLDDPEKAYSDLSEAIRLGNKESDVFMTRGCIHVKKGEYVEAQEDLTKALEYLPKDEPGHGLKEAFLHYKRAYVHRALGRFTEAIAEYTLTIEGEPTAYDAFVERGEVYARIKEIRLALADLDEAIRLQPEKADAYAFRGRLRLQSGDHDLALDDISAAISRDPKPYLYWMCRARIRYEKDDFKGAAEDLTQAHNLNGNSIEVLEARAEVYDKLGEKDKSLFDQMTVERMKRFRASREELRNSLR